MSDIIQGLVKNNEAWSKTHKPSITFAQAPNIKAAMVVSCMDPRTNPSEFFDFGEDGPAVIRNAGARVTEDVLRSIRLLAGIMTCGKNTVGAVAVVHHTDCGLRNFSNGEVAHLLKDHAHLEGERVGEVDKLDFGCFKNAASPEDVVKQDVMTIKNDPYLPKEIQVIGLIYDPFSGNVTEVVRM